MYLCTWANGKDAILPDFYRVRAVPKIARHARVNRSLGDVLHNGGIASVYPIGNSEQ